MRRRTLVTGGTELEYEPGDPVPCCGCIPVRLHDDSDLCTCHCHDAARVALHLIPPTVRREDEL